MYFFLSFLQDLGFISVGVRFEPRDGLLHVMIDQAKALPQHQLTGPPGLLDFIIIQLCVFAALFLLRQDDVRFRVFNN